MYDAGRVHFVWIVVAPIIKPPSHTRQYDHVGDYVGDYVGI